MTKVIPGSDLRGNWQCPYQTVSQAYPDLHCIHFPCVSGYQSRLSNLESDPEVLTSHLQALWAPHPFFSHLSLFLHMFAICLISKSDRTSRFCLLIVSWFAKQLKTIEVSSKRYESTSTTINRIGIQAFGTSF